MVDCASEFVGNDGDGQEESMGETKVRMTKWRVK